MREVRLSGPDARARALRLVRAINATLHRHTPRGTDLVPLPRCEAPKWWGSPRYVAKLLKGRGRIPPCPCVDRSDPDPDCFHVNWGVQIERNGAELVVVLEDEWDLALLVLRGSDVAADIRTGRIEATPRRLPPEGEDLPVEWHARDEVRAARSERARPAPERGPRG